MTQAKYTDMVIKCSADSNRAGVTLIDQENNAQRYPKRTTMSDNSG